MNSYRAIVCLLLPLVALLGGTLPCVVQGPHGAESGVAVTDPNDPVAALVAELDELVPVFLDAYATPGAAVGILHHGVVRAKLGYGFADREGLVAVTEDHAFNIGSISKTVAAWGVMKLVESGALDLDAPVDRYLTRWRLPATDFDRNAVTMRRLLSHTAGLSIHGYRGFAPDEPLPTIEESLSGATNGSGALYVAHEPGSKWQYSGGGYTLAQLVIEEITEQPFAEYMKKEVLAPLGMGSSSYLWDVAIQAIAARPYDALGEPIGGPYFTAMAAAGLQTTLRDFTRFALASMGRLSGESESEALLRPETVEMMQSPAPPAEGYGLGYTLSDVGGVKVVGHGGVNQGWVSQLSVAPGPGHGIVVMTNGTGGGQVRWAITCLWRASVLGEGCDPQPETPVRVEEAVLRSYLGSYEIEGVGTFEVELRRGRLALDQPTGPTLLLVPLSKREFRIRGGVGMIFQVHEERATGFLVRMRDKSELRATRID